MHVLLVIVLVLVELALIVLAAIGVASIRRDIRNPALPFDGQPFPSYPTSSSGFTPNNNPAPLRQPAPVRMRKQSKPSCYVHYLSLVIDNGPVPEVRQRRRDRGKLRSV